MDYPSARRLSGADHHAAFAGAELSPDTASRAASTARGAAARASSGVPGAIEWLPVGGFAPALAPTGAITASHVATAGEVEPASARPRTNPATRPINTRVVRDTAGCYQVQLARGLHGTATEVPMILTLVFVCLLLWFLGLMTSYTLGGVLHILLVVAIVLFLVHIIQGSSVGNA